MKVTVYGASDDLIEVDGDMREEFYADSPALATLLAFSDGTVLGVRYDETGVWRIEPLHQGQATYEHVQAPPADEDNYSDVVTLTLPGKAFEWALHAREWTFARGRA